MHTSNFTVPPFFDITIIYAKCLAHNLRSATRMIINITLVDYSTLRRVLTIVRAEVAKIK